MNHENRRSISKRRRLLRERHCRSPPPIERHQQKHRIEQRVRANERDRDEKDACENGVRQGKARLTIADGAKPELRKADGDGRRQGDEEDYQLEFEFRGKSKF